MTSPTSVLHGARKPREASHPLYASSAGLEAVELAASAGLVLDPWQQDILTASLGERADGQWSAFEVAVIVSRQNGKGALLEARELAGLLLFGERLIMHTAHELKTSMEAFRRVESLFMNSDDLRRRVKKVSHANGDEGIELLNGARLRFVARSKGSGRGFSGDLVVLDEAYALTDEQIEALMPTMSARPNPQIWYTSSPPLDAISCPHLFRVRNRGLAGGDGLAYFDFGCPSDVDLDDRQAWAAANPALGIRITEEFIARERESMSDAGFARERLGVWPSEDAESGPLNVKRWRELADAQSTAGDDVAFALDISPARDVASIAVYGVRPDGFGHVEVVDRRSGTEWVVRRLAELAERYDPVAVGLDVKGPAGSLLVDLDKAGFARPDNADAPKRGQLAIPTASEVAAACGQFADAVTQGTMRHLGDAQPPLMTAVAGVKPRPLGDAWAWGRKHSDVDISPLVAVTLARWAYISRVDAIVTEVIDPAAHVW
ncbi:hypothetical protein AB0L13_16645 [Saccharopolyspora shandongensis]|uniref:hypothetical protein n=1 Tax=Saccharopolyspora shandongensis TaxID=418495 RepID=UPI003423333B